MKQLGPYRLLEELGRGGMGVVWRAEDVRDGRVVALKTLLEGLVQDLELVERFRREGELVRGIRHPNLVEVLDQSLQPPVPYVVFEFVGGETLQQRVEREGPLPPRVAAGIVSEVAAGVAAAHERGLLHRDIKPENVLLSSAGAKLSDFGLIKDLDEDSWRQGMTQSGIAVGTPSFMSPEQVDSAEDRFGEPTDVYGLAATLYYALTGQPPFNGTSAIAVMLAVREDPPPSPRALSPEVPAWLDAVCVRGMAKLGSERYPSALAIRAALLQGGARTRGARGAGLAVGAALALAVGAGLLWVGGVGGSEPPSPPAPGPPPAVVPEVTVEPEVGAAPAPPVDAEVAELLRECVERVERNDDAAAGELVRRVLELDPGNARALAWRGALAAREGRMQSALEYLGRALEVDPSCKDAYSIRAQIRAQQGELEQALADFSAAIEVEPAGELHYARGMLLDMLQRKEEAAGEYGRAIELSPAEIAFYRARAESNVELGRLEEALADLNQALSLDGQDTVLWVQRGKLLNRLKRYAEALSDLERGLAKVPNAYVARYHRAVALGKLGRMEEALAELEWVLASVSGDQQILAKVGLTFRELSRPERGVAAVTKALELGPAAALHVLRAECLLDLGRGELALADCDAAIRLDGDTVGAHTVRAGALRRLGRPLEALRALNDALRHGTQPNLFLQYAEVLSELGRFPEAERMLDRAVELIPHAGLPRLRRGIVRLQLGRHQAAVDDLSVFLREQPDSGVALVNRAQALTALGRTEEALRDLERALAGEERAEYYSARGAVRLRRGELRDALSDLTRAIELGAEGAVHVNRASCLLKLCDTGDFEDALKRARADVDRALALDPELTNAYRVSAQLHRRHNEFAAGVADLDRALELQPAAPGALLERGALKAALEDDAGARADYDRALALEPSARGHLARGQLSRRQGEYGDALEDYARGLALEPDNASLEAARGSALEGLGRLREALTAYRRAFELGLGVGEATVAKLAVARIEKRLAE